MSWVRMKLILILIAILLTVSCDTFNAAPDRDVENIEGMLIPTVTGGAKSPGMWEHEMIQQHLATREAVIERTSVAALYPWQRPGAAATAIATCPEDVWSVRWQKTYPRLRMDTAEFMRRYPHGMVACTRSLPDRVTGSGTVVGFEIIYATPKPKGVYFSEQIPTPIPTPAPTSN